jgi:hypothetical protein
MQPRLASHFRDCRLVYKDAVLHCRRYAMMVGKKGLGQFKLRFTLLSEHKYMVTKETEKTLRMVSMNLEGDCSGLCHVDTVSKL